MERYFPEFMEFFFPDVYSDIDWSLGYEFLDKELQQVVRDAELGRRYVDKLVRVRRLTGDEGWVCVHIEVQGDAEDVFARRMFTYHYRLFDRFGKPLASLAVLADDNPNWRPESFGYELFGCRMSFDFPMVKLVDWEWDMEGLLPSDNAFALVTAAHLLTKKTRGDVSGRYSAKIRLIRILFDRGWERQRIVDFFTVLDWLIRLPDNLETKIFEDIRQIEEERQMQYVTSIERIARKEGVQEGGQEGILEGIEDLMEIKFGEDSLRLLPAIGKIKDVERLREIRRIIKQSKTLDEVEQKILQ